MSHSHIRRLHTHPQSSPLSLLQHYPQSYTLSPNLVRKLWQTLEVAISSRALHPTQADLNQELVELLGQSFPLTPEESLAVQQYIHQRTLLIQDIAASFNRTKLKWNEVNSID